MSKAPALSLSPPRGFSKTSETSCQLVRRVGGEGSGTTTISGIDPTYRVKADYRAVKDPRWRDADYRVSGPGINGGRGGVTGSHTTSGTWVSGKSSYSYSYQNNDCSGTFTWRVQMP